MLRVLRGVRLWGLTMQDINCTKFHISPAAGRRTIARWPWTGHGDDRSPEKADSEHRGLAVRGQDHEVPGGGQDPSVRAGGGVPGGLQPHRPPRPARRAPWRPGRTSFPGARPGGARVPGRGGLRFGPGNVRPAQRPGGRKGPERDGAAGGPGGKPFPGGGGRAGRGGPSGRRAPAGGRLRRAGIGGGHPSGGSGPVAADRAVARPGGGRGGSRLSRPTRGGGPPTGPGASACCRWIGPGCGT
jgi:translation initiation factor IF-2